MPLLPRKAVFNFLLEGVSLLVLTSLIATGLAMYFTLPPGSGQRLVQLGLSRHDWGQLLFWLAMALIGLMLLHIFLHWRWIWSMAKGQNPKRQTVRGVAFLMTTILLLLIALLPWLIPVHPGAGRGGYGRGGYGAPGGEHGFHGRRGFRGGRGQAMKFQSGITPNEPDKNIAD